MEQWNESQVAGFIAQVGAGKVWGSYAERCVEAGIDGKTLSVAEADDLEHGYGFAKVHAKAVISMRDAHFPRTNPQLSGMFSLLGMLTANSLMCALPPTKSGAFATPVTGYPGVSAATSPVTMRGSSSAQSSAARTSPAWCRPPATASASPVGASWRGRGSPLQFSASSGAPSPRACVASPASVSTPSAMRTSPATWCRPPATASAVGVSTSRRGSSAVRSSPPPPYADVRDEKLDTNHRQTRPDASSSSEIKVDVNVEQGFSASSRVIKKRTKPISCGSSRKSRGIRATTVVVSNLLRHISARDLRNIFRTARSVVFDQTCSSRRSAEVTFLYPQDAKRAVREYDGAKMCGEPMSVKMISRHKRKSRNSRDVQSSEDNCFTWEPDYWAQDSPDTQLFEGNCFTCGQPGHWARDCPESFFEKPTRRARVRQSRKTKGFAVDIHNFF